MIVDSHCHIYDEKLNEIRNEILSNLQNQICVCDGDNLETSLKSIKLANDNENIYATVGFHPHEAEKASAGDLEKIEELTKNKKVVAIGEIGLDYYYNYSPKDVQIDVLTKQIILADKLSLPCVFHVREATEDFISILKKNKKCFKIPSVIHSFSGSIETAKIYLSYGFYIGINGIITFKNANKMLDVVKSLPLDRILVETDCPYLTPVPLRGEPNRPQYVKYVIEKIAQLKNISVEEVEKQTTLNALKVFNIKR